MTEFQQFPKIARFSREVVVTEKIDGTNAQIFIEDDGVTMHAGSRSHWLTPGKRTDNHGFAAWVADHHDELLTLGPGRHFGEWWGTGINRGYGLSEKRFSLFNVSKWADPASRPGCWVVPTLWRGIISTPVINDIINILESHGSQAAPGFMQPEGVVIFHTASSTLYKKTILKDEKPKGAA